MGMDGLASSHRDGMTLPFGMTQRVMTNGHVCHSLASHNVMDLWSITHGDGFDHSDPLGLHSTPFTLPWTSIDPKGLLPCMTLWVIQGP